MTRISNCIKSFLRDDDGATATQSFQVTVVNPPLSVTADDQTVSEGSLFTLTGVSFRDASAYAAWLSKATGRTYRLLSEAEWEYVARAGIKTAFWWGDGISAAQANYDGNHTVGPGGQQGKYLERTMPVNCFAPNPWGLYQVHGNVWEWCEDSWHENYHGAPTDGSVWQGGDTSSRAVRGGSWFVSPMYLRAAARVRYRYPDMNLGCRLGRLLVPPRTL